MMVNYEMLSLDSVRKQVVNLLIKSLVKSKKILSTRDLLIFIYDLLVPSKFEKNKNEGGNEGVGSVLCHHVPLF